MKLFAMSVEMDIILKYIREEDIVIKLLEFLIVKFTMDLDHVQDVKMVFTSKKGNVFLLQIHRISVNITKIKIIVWSVLKNIDCLMKMMKRI